MAVSTVTATLSQDGDSVSLPLLASGGDLLLAVDYGKPNLTTHQGGMLYPRTQDQWSGLEQFNVIGRFTGTNAYSDARDLVDLVTSDGNGDSMVFDVPAFTELDSNMNVAPAAEQARALNVTYSPGRKNVVDFDLGLTRIRETLGAYDRAVSTPTGAGTGPVTLSNGTNTVELTYDLVVDRYAGRPNDVIRATPYEYPNYEVKSKTVSDEFEIGIVFSDSDSVTDTQDIASIFREKQGRGSYTLDFQGLYGMGSFDVMPAGSQGLRHTREAGKEGVIILPSLNLRRVTT